MDTPGMAATAATTTILTFLALMPPPSEILQRDATDANDIRVNEYAAAAVSIGIGLVLSLVSASKEPMILAVLTSGGLVIAVEYLTRTNPERSSNAAASYL